MLYGFEKMSPRNGRTLKVIRVARISTINQDERSLDDQLQLLQRTVQQLYDGPVEYHDLATQGSGEKLDREELGQLEDWIESGQFDLVIAEDLARICRRTRAIDFCELCEDEETRLIAINDRVDTIDGSWHDSAFISSWHHERCNRDTSDRIKRSLRGRFLNGAILAEPGTFYEVPEGAVNVADIRKSPTADHVVEHGFRMLEEGRFYAEVADWLNEIGFPAIRDKPERNWDGALVKERFLDTRLIGIENWNEKVTIRVNSTGRRKTIIAPPELNLQRPCPHMAFVRVERFEALKRRLEKKASNYHSDSPETDPRRGRPRRRTPFPGQMTYCGICGRKYVFGGHGQREHLMCDGARSHLCWNGVTIDGPLAAQKVAEAVLSEAESIPDFDADFRERVNREGERADAGRIEQIAKLRADAQAEQRTIENYVRFVARGDTSARIRELLEVAESGLEDIHNEIQELESAPRHSIEIPGVDELKAMAREVLRTNTPFTWEFNAAMRRLIPRLVVFPFRLMDSPRVVLRGQFRLFLGDLVSDERTRNAIRDSLEKTVCINLFDPPQREQFREDVVRLRKSGVPQAVVAGELGITVTAAQRAAALQRMLDEAGMVDPYLPVREPSADLSKLRRHLHPRYEFRPLADAGEF